MFSHPFLQAMQRGVSPILEDALQSISSNLSNNSTMSVLGYSHAISNAFFPCRVLALKSIEFIFLSL